MRHRRFRHPPGVRARPSCRSGPTSDARARPRGTTAFRCPNHAGPGSRKGSSSASSSGWRLKSRTSARPSTCITSRGELSAPVERAGYRLGGVAPLRRKEPELEVVHHDGLACLQVGLQAIPEPGERGFSGEQEPCEPAGLRFVAEGVVPGGLESRLARRAAVHPRAGGAGLAGARRERVGIARGHAPRPPRSWSPWFAPRRASRQPCRG